MLSTSDQSSYLRLAFAGSTVVPSKFTRSARPIDGLKKRPCRALHMRVPMHSSTADDAGLDRFSPWGSGVNGGPGQDSVNEEEAVIGGEGSGPANRYGEGSGGGGGGGGGGDDGDGDFQLPPEALLVLKEAGKSTANVPRDVLEGIAAGRADASHLKTLLEIQNNPFLGPLAAYSEGLRNRLILNTRFWMVVTVELMIGFGSKTFVEVKTRAEKFWKEFDFYLSDIALELVGDFSLVWLLSPAMRFSPPPTPGTISAYLDKMPKHALQAGSFSLLQRLCCIGYKGTQFGLVGFFASLIGHSATKALVSVREQLNPDDVSDVKLAPVLDNSLGWGFFMLSSSSPRYQLVNAWEQRVVDTVFANNLPVATALTFAVRLANCIFGGEHWMIMAKQLGLQ